jgi:hypothetical protein
LPLPRPLEKNILPLDSPPLGGWLLELTASYFEGLNLPLLDFSFPLVGPNLLFPWFCFLANLSSSFKAAWYASSTVLREKG